MGGGRFKGGLNIPIKMKGSKGLNFGCWIIPYILSPSLRKEHNVIYWFKFYLHCAFDNTLDLFLLPPSLDTFNGFVESRPKQVNQAMKQIRVTSNLQSVLPLHFPLMGSSSWKVLPRAGSGLVAEEKDLLASKEDLHCGLSSCFAFPKTRYFHVTYGTAIWRQGTFVFTTGECERERKKGMLGFPWWDFHLQRPLSTFWFPSLHSRRA